MKQAVKHLMQKVILCGLATLFVGTLNSCSTESIDDTMAQDNLTDLEQSRKGPIDKLVTWEDQIDFLTKKMTRFHNFEVAQAQGYVVLAGPYVPNMGYHYLNPDKINGEFNLLEPELLVYHPDENGNMIFGAAEYLVPIPGLSQPSCEATIFIPTPEGFIGSEDEWEENCNAGGWTLHAWVGLENPMGVFHHTNPLVPGSDVSLD